MNATNGKVLVLGKYGVKKELSIFLGMNTIEMSFRNRDRIQGN